VSLELLELLVLAARVVDGGDVEVAGLLPSNGAGGRYAAYGTVARSKTGVSMISSFS
jgi:hypothetical protein